MNALLSKGVGVCALLTLVSTGCAGDPERSSGPISPSAAALTPQVGVTNPGSPATLSDAEMIGAGEHSDAAAAAINLTGAWPGTLHGDKITVKFTHTGTRLKGVYAPRKDDAEAPPGFSFTFDLTQKSISGTKRTFQGTLKITEKGQKCSPATMPGTMVVNTGAKPMTMTGTFSGKDTDCAKGTGKFTFRRS